MTRNGYVYLICDPANNTYKIGVTRDLQSKRIKKLQTGNSTVLHIVSVYESEYPFKLERMLHLHFTRKRELNEWFNLTNEDIVNFKKTCKELNNVIISIKDNPYFNRY